MRKCKGLGCKLGTYDNMNESDIGEFDIKMCGYLCKNVKFGQR